VKICALDGCDTPAKQRDRLCSMHNSRLRRHGDVDYAGRPKRSDDHLRVPLVCVCPTARPDRGGQCVDCWRPVVALWPAGRFRVAVAAYPQLTNQSVDWTLRGKAVE